MTVKELIDILIEIGKAHGEDCPIDIITETPDTQTEQPLQDVAISPAQKRVKLLPENF